MTRARALAAAVPQRVWVAVASLVLLASLGLGTVLGAGLSAWRGAVGVVASRPHVVISPPSSAVVVVPTPKQQDRSSAPGTSHGGRAGASVVAPGVQPNRPTAVPAPSAAAAPQVDAPSAAAAPAAPVTTSQHPRLVAGTSTGPGKGRHLGNGRHLGWADAAPAPADVSSPVANAHVTAAPAPSKHVSKNRGKHLGQLRKAAHAVGHGHPHPHPSSHGHGRGHNH